MSRSTNPEALDTPSISIVIGFKDWGLDKLLGAIRSIKNAPNAHDLEVVISDFGSTDPTGYADAISAVGGRYIYTETDGIWSRSRALNAGIKKAKGRFIITSDADMVFSPTTFPKAAELLEQNPHSVFILQCRDLPEGITHEDILDGDIDWTALESASRLRPRWGMGGFIAFERRAYLESRGLDERMVIYGGEDIDMANRLRRLGYPQLWLNDSAIRMYHVWHESSRDTASNTPDGRQAIKTNRAIHLTDDSIIRNLTNWKGRPDEYSPLVTVAISTHNRAKYLRDSINSVLGQTFSDWELIVVDDGSSDETQSVLAEFDDPRIIKLAQENQGLAAARNRITKIARGRYIAVHDDDDIMLPKRLESCLNAIQSGANGAYGGWIDFDNDSGRLFPRGGKNSSIEAMLFTGGVYLHPTLMVEKRVLEKFPYNESMKSGSDYNLAIRMLRSGVKLSHCNSFVLLRRCHDGQITGTDSTTQKTSAVISAYFARANMLTPDVKKSRQRQESNSELLGEPDNLSSEIYPYLPDHLVKRSISTPISVVSKPNYEALARQARSSKNAISIDVQLFDEAENWKEWYVSDPSLNDVFSLTSQNIDSLAITATPYTGDENEIDTESPRSLESSEHSPIQIAVGKIRAPQDGTVIFQEFRSNKDLPAPFSLAEIGRISVKYKNDTVFVSAFKSETINGLFQHANKLRTLSGIQLGSHWLRIKNRTNA